MVYVGFIVVALSCLVVLGLLARYFSSSSERAEAQQQHIARRTIAGPLASLSAGERLVVRRALQVWLDSRAITQALHAELSATVHDANEEDTSRVAVALAFLVLAIAIMLLESLASETLLAFLLSPFLWLFEVPAFGKAACLLTLAASTLPLRARLPSAHHDGLPQEAVRAFLVLSFLGAAVLGAVDTGQHAGETASASANGSHVWYVSVGLAGALGFAILGHVAAGDFRWALLWAIAALGLVACSGHGHTLICLQLASFGMLGYGRLLHAHDWQWAGLCLLLLAAGHAELSRIFDDSSTEEPTTRMLPLLPVLPEIVRPRLRPGGELGTTLGPYSGFALAAGLANDHKDLSAVSAFGAVVAAGLALWGVHHRTPHYAHLGFCVTYLIALALATAAIGGMGVRPLVRLPPRAREGVADVLVVTTLVLLLALVVLGNSDSAEEWARLMDFSSAKVHWNRGSVKAEFEYSQRLVLLPFSLPVFVYYHLLCQRWPAQEQKVRGLHVVRVAAYLAVGCHCMRLVSWSSLLLVLSALTAALPWVEALICRR